MVENLRELKPTLNFFDSYDKRSGVNLEIIQNQRRLRKIKFTLTLIHLHCIRHCKLTK